ncbi:hypothetical protein GCM10017161_25770 [Thalassotalea marina]|uniref:Uncharacterized protein n=1 Tax=Thalassotalea marina TaxID=1673741 RepID=A0A919BL78_9GAMM|nr:hypothetical protein GCM10017161_25770 [Thalassotalea marina]
MLRHPLFSLVWRKSVVRLTYTKLGSFCIVNGECDNVRTKNGHEIKRRKNYQRTTK